MGTPRTAIVTGGASGIGLGISERLAAEGFVESRQGAGTEGKPAMFVTVFSRGLCKHQFTAVFLEDDAGLGASEILRQVPAERRATLVARKIADARYEWDIWMQTDKETVFFDYM